MWINLPSEIPTLWYTGSLKKVSLSGDQPARYVLAITPGLKVNTEPKASIPSTLTTISVFKNTISSRHICWDKCPVTPSPMLIDMPICKNETLHIGEGEKNYTQEKSDTLVDMVWHEKSSVFFMLTLTTIVEKRSTQLYFINSWQPCFKFLNCSNN